MVSFDQQHIAEEKSASIPYGALSIQRPAAGISGAMAAAIADVVPELRTAHQLVKAADARLYEAKRGGRDRVVV